MDNTLSFDANPEGIREFAKMIAELQEAGARFTIDCTGARLHITIPSGDK